MDAVNMKFSQRKFSGTPDIVPMQALACAWPGSPLHTTDLPWRLTSWALDDPENVALWVDDAGQLAAWAVLQTPF
jgi:hypothetical protein